MKKYIPFFFAHFAHGISLCDAVMLLRIVALSRNCNETATILGVERV